MGQGIPQNSWTDTPLAEKLMAISDNAEFHRVLRYRRQHITQSVIQRLKDKVSQLARTNTQQALKLAEVVREVAELTEDPICQALAHHAYGQAAHVSGQYTKAIEAYGQAESIYESLGQQVAAARIARARIDALMYLGRYETALLVADKARKIFKQHQEETLLAQLEMNVGNIYHRLDQYRDALEFYQLAEVTFAAQEDEFGLAKVRFNQANQYTQLNEFEKALTLYEQAKQSFDRLDMPLLFNQTEYSIAWLLFMRGRYRESLRLFARVRTKAQELGDATLAALCDLDQAEVYLQLNAYQDTLASATSALMKFDQLNMNYERAKANMYMGVAQIHLNQLAAAEPRLREAHEGFLLEGNEVYAALADIYLSDVFTHWNDLEQALDLCTEAKDIFLGQNLSAKSAHAELQQARLKLSLGNPDEARSLCQSALQSIKQAQAPWLEYQCLHLLGNMAQQSGQNQEAHQFYTRSIDRLESMRNGIQLDELKCTFMKDKLRVYEDLVNLCLTEGTEEKIDQAFTYAEAAKSRSLVELLATDRSIASKTHEPSVEQLHREWDQLREELNQVYNRINQYQGRTDRRPAWLGPELHNEVREREHQLAQLARRLSLEDAEFASLHRAPLLSSRQVRQSLAEDEVLVEYTIVNGEVHVFTLSQDAIGVTNNITTTDDLAPLLQWLKFYIDQFTLAGRLGQTQPEGIVTLTHDYLEMIHAALISPITSSIEGKNIIIVPHGLLHYVPFHALYDGCHYLIDEHEISYAPSASAYRLCLEKAQMRQADGRVLIMGLPDEAAPLIRDEAEAVKSLWPEAQLLLGEEATLDQLKTYAPRCRLLHLASHSIFRRDNPMFSALKLSDSWLNLYDIFNLNLNADLVTLSACETGMNEVFPGDELFGLMRGFLYAGAPSLIVSLWVVHDRSTAEFMRILYAALRQGLSKRAAMRQAQLSVREEFQHPYHWAPFILMGAPS